MDSGYYVNKGALRTLVESFISVHTTPTTYAANSCLKRLRDRINLMPTLSYSDVTNTAYLEWWEEWSPSTPECPRECIGGGWKCNHCQVDIGEYLTMCGGERCYFDQYETMPKIAFCPSCGRKFTNNS